MKQEEPSEAGARTVEVPVVSIDPQTQEKVELPVTAQIEVAAGTEAPQAVEVDAVPSAAIAGEAATDAPLNARIVEASGERWSLNFGVDAQDDGAAMRRIYAETSSARRAGLATRVPVVAPPAARPRVELRPRADERVGFAGSAGGSK